jgi:hypothetical protein
MRAEDVEIYYDPAELIGGLLISPSQSEPEDNTVNTATATHGCPFSKKSNWTCEDINCATGHCQHSCLDDESIHLFAR